MAYDEAVAKRLRDLLGSRPNASEKKMFGGSVIMYRGHMLIGVAGSSLMARVGPDQHDEALSEPHVRVMDFTGTPMRGYVFIDPPGFESDEQLDNWVGKCVRFNMSMPAKK